MLFKDFDNSNVSLEYTRTSKGNQPKWKEGKYWFKQDMLGYEALSEVLISSLLDKSNLSDRVVYEPAMIRYNKRTAPGCCSIDFKNSGEELFTLERMHLAYTGETVADSFMSIKSTEKRIDHIVRFIEDHTGISEAGTIITKWLEADAFFLNEDRHTNNIAFLRNEKSGLWRFCPYYDNGLALLSDVSDYPLGERVSALASEVPAKPFSRQFSKQVKAAHSLYGTQLALSFTEDDVREALVPVQDIYDAGIIERVKDLIRVQRNRYKELFEE